MDLPNLLELDYRNVFFAVMAVVFSLIFWSIFLSWSVRITAKFRPRFKSLVAVVFIWQVCLVILGFAPDILPGSTVGSVLSKVVHSLITIFIIAYLTQWLIISREKPTAKKITKFKVGVVFWALTIAFIAAMALLDYVVRNTRI